jgi:imidazolonepropionase-like amidohydrolase
VASAPDAGIPVSAPEVRGSTRNPSEAVRQGLRDGVSVQRSRLSIQNVSVVDVAKGSVRDHCSVIIDGGRIEAITDAPPRLPGRIFDGRRLYLCPGLIDCHVHFFLDGSDSPRLNFINSDDQGKLDLARANARRAIEAGITTMRDCGSPAPLIFALKEEVERGEICGPHIIACGFPLMRPKGHCHFIGGEVATVSEVRSAIELQLKQGAGFVKLIASGGGLTPGIS